MDNTRAMTYRERRAAQKMWNAFQSDKEHGAFTVCTAGERKQVIAVLREHIRDIVPEIHRHKVRWPVRIITPELMSIGWSYSP